MSTYPPTPFPWKGMMQVQPRRGFHVCFFSRLWGGPAGG